MKPPFLKPGDTIGICATARWLTKDQLEPALQLFTEWGYKVKVTENVLVQQFQLAGTDQQRTQGFMELWNDPEIKAIIIARGGYGTVRVVDHLTWKDLGRKWVCGYSDITVLLNHLTNGGSAGIHSTMPISFPDATMEALINLRRALEGKLDRIDWEVADQSSWEVKGKWIGGNLSVIYSQLGSNTQLQPDGDILFIEDVDEMHYHIDRMMMALKRSGIIARCKAMVVGGLTQMKDNTTEFGFSLDNPWGKDAQQTIANIAASENIPVVFDFPAGHQNDNRAFYMGVDAALRINGSRASVEFKL